MRKLSFSNNSPSNYKSKEILVHIQHNLDHAPSKNSIANKETISTNLNILNFNQTPNYYCTHLTVAKYFKCHLSNEAKYIANQEIINLYLQTSRPLMCHFTYRCSEVLDP